MVGTYRQHLACVAAQLNGVKRHRSMKPSSRDPQLGLASPLNYAANKSGKIKTKSPSKKEAGAGCKSPALASREGTGETFFLDILFHRHRFRSKRQLWTYVKSRYFARYANLAKAFSAVAGVLQSFSSFELIGACLSNPMYSRAVAVRASSRSVSNSWRRKSAG